MELTDDVLTSLTSHFSNDEFLFICIQFPRRTIFDTSMAVLLLLNLFSSLFQVTFLPVDFLY
jgi:hypothetical protein